MAIVLDRDVRDALAPVLSNLLVKAAAMDRIDRARIEVLLGMGDAHGSAAIEWTLRTIGRSQNSETETIIFGDPLHRYPALPFDFADQYVVRRTRGIADARTLLAFDTPLPARLAFALLRRIAASPALSRIFITLSPFIRFGSERASLCVEVDGHRSDQPLQRRIMCEGR